MSGTMSEPPGPVVLHVGAPKSGTTALQDRLLRNADALAERGVLVPRAPGGRGLGSIVFRAALDLTGRRMGRPASYAAGWWARLVAQVAAWDGVAVVSHEALVRCDAALAARAVAELGAGGREVHVVYTARDLGRSLVSAWLEGLKHGTTHDLVEHLEKARSGRLPVLRGLDLPAVLGTWITVVPPERVHLVTVPPSGGDRSLLWVRFCAAAGIDPAWAPVEAAADNDAVGLPEAQLLLALNRLLGPDAARGGRHHAAISGPLAAALSGGLSGGRSDRVRLDPAQTPWIEERAAAWVGWARTSGIDLVGDLDDLRPRPLPRPRPADPGTSEASYVDPAQPHPGVADAAALALRALLER